MGNLCSSAKGEVQGQGPSQGPKQFKQAKAEAYKLAEEIMTENTGIKFDTKYEKMQSIGRGAFAQVVQCKHRVS